MSTKGTAGAEAGLAAYEFAVFEAMFESHGNAEFAAQNREEIRELFQEGVPAPIAADMIYELNVDYDDLVRLHDDEPAEAAR